MVFIVEFYCTWHEACKCTKENADLLKRLLSAKLASRHVFIFNNWLDCKSVLPDFFLTANVIMSIARFWKSTHISASNSYSCLNTDYQHVPHLDICYKIYNDRPMTWLEARTFCEQHSSHLLILDSIQMEHYFVNMHFYGNVIYTVLKFCYSVACILFFDPL